MRRTQNSMSKHNTTQHRHGSRTLFRTLPKSWKDTKNSTMSLNRKNSEINKNHLFSTPNESINWIHCVWLLITFQKKNYLTCRVHNEARWQFVSEWQLTNVFADINNRKRFYTQIVYARCKRVGLCSIVFRIRINVRACIYRTRMDILGGVVWIVCVCVCVWVCIVRVRIEIYALLLWYC